MSPLINSNVDKLKVENRAPSTHRLTKIKIWHVDRTAHEQIQKPRVLIIYLFLACVLAKNLRQRKALSTCWKIAENLTHSDSA